MMSDDDRDIDIESDDDDELNASTQYMTQAEKRAHHNALERKRRDHIKESFSSLRDSVPCLHGEKVGIKNNKASRAQILKQATEYIQFMTKKNSAIQIDIDDLKKQNNTLEQQVRALDRAKTTGAFAAQSSTVSSTSKAESKLLASEGYLSSSDSELSTPTGRHLVSGGKRKKLKTEK